MSEWSGTDSEPAVELAVSDLATLRLLSDPLRSRLVELLRAAPLTVKELAARLSMGPKQLYYHIGLLERHGVIRVVGTRLVSGIVEKRYRATAQLFSFDQQVFASQASDELPEGIGLLFEATRTQLAQSIAAGSVGLGALKEVSADPQTLLAAWTLTRLTPAEAQQFYAQFAALCQAFHRPPAQQPADGQLYRLFVMLFPVTNDRMTG